MLSSIFCVKPYHDDHPRGGVLKPLSRPTTQAGPAMAASRKAAAVVLKRSSIVGLIAGCPQYFWCQNAPISDCVRQFSASSLLPQRFAFFFRFLLSTYLPPPLTSYSPCLLGAADFHRLLLLVRSGTGKLLQSEWSRAAGEDALMLEAGRVRIHAVSCAAYIQQGGGFFFRGRRGHIYIIPYIHRYPTPDTGSAYGYILLSSARRAGAWPWRGRASLFPAGFL